ncbi:hypothetical protein PC123_g23182 [Phytophthora cactorum]|nr:hypothetical protein PC123_g23182 [Phytophthora cactorum]
MVGLRDLFMARLRCQLCVAVLVEVVDYGKESTPWEFQQFADPGVA